MSTNRRWLIGAICLATAIFILRNTYHTIRYDRSELDTVSTSTVEPSKTPELTFEGQIRAKVASVSKRYGVSSYRMTRIIQCESHFQNIQSRVISKITGQREDSWGIVQIHLPSHPSIKKTMALDVDFAVEFLAQQIAAGNGWKWYGYNVATDTCASGY